MTTAGDEEHGSDSGMESQSSHGVYIQDSDECALMSDIMKVNLDEQIQEEDKLSLIEGIREKHKIYRQEKEKFRQQQMRGRGNLARRARPWARRSASSVVSSSKLAAAKYVATKVRSLSTVRAQGRGRVSTFSHKNNNKKKNDADSHSQDDSPSETESTRRTGVTDSESETIIIGKR